MARSNEALFWSLFAAGGALAALFLPALILATGLLLPTDDPDRAAQTYNQFDLLLAGGWWAWPLRLVLFGVVFLGFFHCAHRIRHTAADLGLKPLGPLLAWLCYGGATVGAVFAAWVLATI